MNSNLLNNQGEGCGGGRAEGEGGWRKEVARLEPMPMASRIPPPLSKLSRWLSGD